MLLPLFGTCTSIHVKKYGEIKLALGALLVKLNGHVSAFQIYNLANSVVRITLCPNLEPYISSIKESHWS